ncbi:MAG: hypothetical protein ACI906_001137 [Candidatus Latescibacterota bacterium]|jgi:hypothetical protein
MMSEWLAVARVSRRSEPNEGGMGKGSSATRPCGPQTALLSFPIPAPALSSTIVIHHYFKVSRSHQRKNRYE